MAALLRLLRLRFRFRNLSKAYFFVDRGADIYVHPHARLRFGRGVRLMRDFSGHFFGDVSIGNNVFVNRGCYFSIRAGLSIGDNCLLAEGVSIHDDNHVFGASGGPLSEQGFSARAIWIGSNVWIGAKATVLSGVRIGDNAVIGANAVVTHDIPPGCVAVGVPARVIRRVG